MLDAVGALVHILEEASTGKLTMQDAMEAAQMSLRLLGNASMNANRERRRNVIQDLNPNLLEMSEDNNLFTKATPLLLGEGCSKKAKERHEKLKCLSQATAKRQPLPRQNQQFFRPGRSQNQYAPRGGGQNFRDEEVGTSTGTTLIQRTQGISRSQEVTNHVAKTTLISHSILFPLLEIKIYLINPMTSPIVESLSNMGIRNMAQRIARNHSQIAGRINMFLNILQDQWVINCVQGYTLDLIQYPCQQQTPHRKKHNLFQRRYKQCYTNRL